jgi:hypothetical protein
MRQERLLRQPAARRELAFALAIRPWRAVRALPYRGTMTERSESERDGDERVADALASGDAARQVANLTGMSPDAAATYAAFVSGRWALTRP